MQFNPRGIPWSYCILQLALESRPIEAFIILPTGRQDLIILEFYPTEYAMCAEPVTDYDGAISLTPRIRKPGDEGIKEAVYLLKLHLPL